MSKVVIDGHSLTIADVNAVARDNVTVELAEKAKQRIVSGRRIVDKMLADGTLAYGVTTGVGKLSDVLISAEHVEALQKNLIRSHACAVGKALPDDVVRAVCLLRANALAKGYSGVRLDIVTMLCDMLNRGVVPVVPEQGSLGASGDLAPLAHIALVLMGEGEARVDGKVFSGVDALQAVDLEPLTLQAKEGLALINGTQIMTGIGSLAVRDAELLSVSADVISALTCEAVRGIPSAFDGRIHAIRPHDGQIETAKNMLKLLEGSNLTTDMGEIRVQDAYTIRCIPQVHGASKTAFAHARDVITIELNSATDNPLLFSDQPQVLSGGNFHGQPLALVLDYAALGCAELGNMSERRVERLVNPALSGLPAFLTRSAGLQSGFMILQYTAASLVSENKVLASPASVDSIPSSANQEDHVSMGTISARKFATIVDNVARVMAIELLCAAQACEFHPHRKLGRGSQIAYDFVRSLSATVDEDRTLSKDIELVAARLRQGGLASKVTDVIGA